MRNKPYLDGYVRRKNIEIIQIKKGLRNKDKKKEKKT